MQGKRRERRGGGRRGKRRSKGESEMKKGGREEGIGNRTGDKGWGVCIVKRESE